MSTYLFDTEHKRAVRHSNMLLECIERERQSKLKHYNNDNKRPILSSTKDS